MTPEHPDPPWNLVVASVAGTAHRGGVCQDHAAGRTVATAAGAVLLLAVSDGAGSASHSELGAGAAVAAFLDAAAADVAGIGFGEIAPDHARGWAEAARRAVVARAEAEGLPTRQLACTLLGAAVGPASAWFAQVGDGAIVFDGDGADAYDFAFWPDSGEYANTTRFLTDADLADHLRVDRLDRPVGALGMLTDGLQGLALDYTLGRVHAPFFAPLFRVVAGSDDLLALGDSLRAFLDSPRVNARTDDDKTLVLATRRPPVPSEARHAGPGPAA